MPDNEEVNNIVPQTKAIVRGSCYVSNFLINIILYISDRWLESRTSSRQSKATKGTLMHELDLKGSIPASVYKVAFKQ